MDPTAAAPAPPASGREQRGRLAGLVGLAAATAYVGAVDPGRAGLFPPCPSRVVLGLDCPACGGLRGAHDLLRGDVVAALDHNPLLPLWLAAIALALAAWVPPLAGRRSVAWRPPRWLVVAGVAMAGVFTLLRNLPIAGLEFLASGG
ncbi:MAG TPA: DUF2752 domain-containing protein [Acidimicrobiales bacterium]